MIGTVVQVSTKIYRLLHYISRIALRLTEAAAFML